MLLMAFVLLGASFAIDWTNGPDVATDLWWLQLGLGIIGGVLFLSWLIALEVGRR